MYKVYFKVPFYDNSDFMGHLVEHVILHPDKAILEQCALSPRIWGSLSGERIWIDFEYLDDKETILKMLYRQITQDTIDYEYKIFNEEFGWLSYVNRVLEKCNTLLYSDNRSKKPRLFTLEEVQKYHNTYIKNGNYVLQDTTSKTIIEHNYDLKLLKSNNLYWMPNISYDLVYLEWQKNYILYCESSNSSSLVFFYFLYDIIKSRDIYRKRYQLESYYTHSPSDYYSIDCCVIRISPHCALDITEEFFNSQKKYFLKQLRENWYPSLEIVSMLYYDELYNHDEWYNLIQSIDFKYYMTIVQEIKNLW